jgi:hypothetical protein
VNHSWQEFGEDPNPREDRSVNRPPGAPEPAPPPAPPPSVRKMGPPAPATEAD